jgi:hypothetical protein
LSSHSTADLSDIHQFHYSAGKFSSQLIIPEEITSAHLKAHPHKAPSPDGIPMYYIKLMGMPLLECLNPFSKPVSAFLTTPFS